MGGAIRRWQGAPPAPAAGHRPCGECRRADYVRFKEAWATVRGLDTESVKAGDIDRGLHPERVAGQGKHRHKPTFTATFGSIPDGVVFHQGQGDLVAMLKWKGRAWAWGIQRSPDRGCLGYREEDLEVIRQGAAKFSGHNT